VSFTLQLVTKQFMFDIWFCYPTDRWGVSAKYYR